MRPSPVPSFLGLKFEKCAIRISGLELIRSKRYGMARGVNCTHDGRPALLDLARVGADAIIFATPVPEPLANAPAMPFFSVIVPSRNRPTLLERALRSIAEQSFDDYEVVVIDDGSDAGPAGSMAETVAKLGARFQLVRREPGAGRHGPNAARNEGLQRARGCYVGFLDDDDFWCDSEHLRHAAAYLDSEQGVGVDVYLCNQVAKRGDNVIVPRWLPYLDRATARPSPSNGAAMRVDLDDLLQPEGIGFAHVNMTLARRDLVVAMGGFWELAPYEGDLNFFLRLTDIANGFAYRSATVSVNTVRSSETSNGVSSLDVHSKRLLRLLACQHAELACTRPETRAYARLLQGGVWKTLSKQAYGERDFKTARDLARRAVAVCPSLRWRLISAALTFKALLP